MGSQRGSPAIANMPSPYGGMYSSPGALPPGNHMTGTDGTDPYQPQWGYSPETIASELLSADLASTRWLDLLATDAAQADGGFSLTATPAPAPSPAPEGGNIVYDGLSDPQAAVIRAAAESEAVASEKDAWQLSEDIVLSEHETVLFRLFAERAALWVSHLPQLFQCSVDTTNV